MQGELDCLSQTLTGRIRQLAERYATPLPDLAADVDRLADKVAGHLERMGPQAMNPKRAIQPLMHTD